jgi:DNA-binding response OmpR family regulator
MAKVQAVLRRTYDFNEQIHIMEHRGAMLNTADASLVYQGEKIDLSRNEYRILETLLEHKGMVVSREKLIERLWESDSFIDENTLSVNVNRLRKKLDTAGLTKFITTKVGMGYLIK